MKRFVSKMIIAAALVLIASGSVLRQVQKLLMLKERLK